MRWRSDGGEELSSRGARSSMLRKTRYSILTLTLNDTMVGGLFSPTVTVRFLATHETFFQSFTLKPMSIIKHPKDTTSPNQLHENISDILTVCWIENSF